MSLLDADLNEGLKDVTKVIDSSFESEGERQATLTERLKIDTTSPFMLAHIVRPIITLTLLAIQIAIIVAMFLGVVIPEHVVYEVGGLLFSAIGFYFNSRKAEKINAKKVQAAIEIQKDKARIELIKDRQQIKEDKKLSRKERRQS